MGRISLVLLIAVLVGGWSSIFVIDETQLAIVTQMGKYKRTIDQPGLNFKLPFGIQDVHRMESRILGSDTPMAQYLTLDKKRLIADPITRWKIVSPLTFYTKVNNELSAKARLDDIVKSELRRELASHDFDEIVGSARDPLMQEVATNAREKTKKFGIEIVDVRIKRADLPREVQESVFQRMRAERDREAKKYRAQGAELAAKIRAETDKEKTIILAEAYQIAEKSRGEGDAESVKIYAEAYGQDPEFYEFTRRLETYEKAMKERSELVISTGADLFKYLEKP